VTATLAGVCSRASEVPEEPALAR